MTKIIESKMNLKKVWTERWAMQQQLEKISQSVKENNKTWQKLIEEKENGISKLKKQNKQLHITIKKLKKRNRDLASNSKTDRNHDPK